MVRTATQTGPDPWPASAADRALDVLAATHQTALALLDARWSDVRAALEAGAGVGRVAAALGLTVPQVIAGVREWTDRAVREGRLTGPEADRVRGLADGWPGRSGPGRPGRSAVDSSGQPRCLPGCGNRGVWDHVCLVEVGEVEIEPVYIGRDRSAAVEVEQGAAGRAVVIAEVEDGRYRGATMALPAESVPRLVALLLDAHRIAR